MARVGTAWRAQGIGAIYLIHGTFVGDDAFGAWHRLAQFWAPLAFGSRLEKRLVDLIVRDVGNYTVRYARELAEGLNAETPESDAPLEVRRWIWSSQNNHVGRADAALRLIGELTQRAERDGRRVLFWGHSHGGNVLALVSNLLGADEATRASFLECCRPYYERLGGRSDEHPVWQGARAALCDEGERTKVAPFDVVTYGTPVRYGWDLVGGSRLLHVVHHQRENVRSRRETGLPFRPLDAWTAREGDYVQRIGVAGTDFAPCFVFRRGARRANRELRGLFERELIRSGWFDPMRAALRVADEGSTVAVDYGPQRGGPLFHLFGHGVYTRRAWMLFHAELIAEWLERGEIVDFGNSMREGPSAGIVLEARGGAGNVGEGETGE